MTAPNTPIDPKLISRIQKLHAMAEGAKQVGSLAEADSFMSAVQKTLAAHNLDMSVLAIDMKNLTDPLGRDGFRGVGDNGKMSRHSGKVVEWIRDLGTAVAEAHYCACNYSAASDYLWFYGRESNRKTAVLVFKYLRDMAERLGYEAYAAEVDRRRKENGSERGAGPWRLDWLEGFAREVSTRYRAMRVHLDQDRSLAVVLVGVLKEASDHSHEDLSSERWKKLRLPDSDSLAGEWQNMTLWDVPRTTRANRFLTKSYQIEEVDRDILKVMMAFVRRAPWDEIGMAAERNNLLSEAQRYWKWLEGVATVSGDGNSDARALGAQAARRANLRPQSFEDSGSNAKRLGSGS